MFAVHALRVGAMLTAAGDALARPMGQSTARWQVLAAVQDAPAPVAGIARRLGLARQSVQRVADLLVAEGLASYVANPAHQRAKLLRLRAAGRTTLDAIQAAQREWADALGAEIGEPELRRAARVLARVAAALEARAPAE
ncbi:MAG TPA: MarR family transcriptional regulator [Gemmatimonadaceae bacterium]|nr:MarR family transcriptional regulator [Gemmatimonadaceae bacterium]